jgi:hypothetical protein
MKKKVETQFEAIILFGEMILNNFNLYPQKYDLIHKYSESRRIRNVSGDLKYEKK